MNNHRSLQWNIIAIMIVSIITTMSIIPVGYSISNQDLKNYTNKTVGIDVKGNFNNLTNYNNTSVFSILYIWVGGFAGGSNIIVYDSISHKIVGVDFQNHLRQHYLDDSNQTKLLNLINEKDFFNTANYYGAGMCMDCAHHFLQIQVNDKIHSTQWFDNSNVPDLQEIANEILKQSR